MHMPASQAEKVSLPCLHRKFRRKVGYSFALGKMEIDSFPTALAMQKRAVSGGIAHYAAEYTIVREPSVSPPSLQRRRSSVALVVVLRGALPRLWCGPVRGLLMRSRCGMRRLRGMNRRSALNHRSGVRLRCGLIRCRWRPSLPAVTRRRTIFRGGRPRRFHTILLLAIDLGRRPPLLRLSSLFRRSSSLRRSRLLRGPRLVRWSRTVHGARRLRTICCGPVLGLRRRPLVAIVEGRPWFTDAKLLRFPAAFRSWVA